MFRPVAGTPGLIFLFFATILMKSVAIHVTPIPRGLACENIKEIVITELNIVLVRIDEAEAFHPVLKTKLKYREAL